AKRAKPMIVVMPAGHTAQTTGGAPPLANSEDFVQDFVKDIVPFVEKNYRVIADRPHRAIAGLSMGGNHTLNIAIPHQDQFTYVGVFSSGLLGTVGGGRRPAPAPGAAAAPPPPPTPDPPCGPQHLPIL